MGLNWIRQACEGVSRGLPRRGQLQGVAGCGRPHLSLADRTLEEQVSKDRQEVGRGKTGGRGILPRGSQSQLPRWGGAGLAGPEGNIGHVGDSLDFVEAGSSARLPQTV